jgi:predicted amidohydrolase YtcJ
MKINRRFALAGMAATSLASSLPDFRSITIYEARKIVTMSSSFPSAKFMAVSGGIILGLANTKEDLAVWAQGRDVKHNRMYADKVLFPGLIDPHIHPMQASVMLGLPFLAPDDWTLPSRSWPGVKDQGSYRDRLKKIVAESVDIPTIVWGHHDLFHGPLDRTILDSIVPDRPLLVWQRSFHDIYANSAALSWMGFSDEANFSSSVISSGAKTTHANYARGVFSETALPLALDRLQNVLLDPVKLQAGFGGLLQLMQRRGVTTTSDLATGIFAGFDQEAALITSAFNSSQSSARVNLMPIANEIDSEYNLDQWISTRKSNFFSDNILLGKRVKLFADGAFFAQNMRLAPPGYSDGHLGKWLTEPDVLKSQMERYWNSGFALHIHVNGDEGTEVVLENLESLDPKYGQDIVLEHLGYCNESQIRRISKMGLMVSAQPNYIRVLGEAYGRGGMGPDRASVINRLGSLERAAVPFGLHSDFNMAPIDPFYLAWIAETREGLDGIPRGLSERISREKALRAITVEAAQVIGLDSLVGSLEAGKKADFIVLDRDPHVIEAAAMKELPVLATVFEGRT